MAKDANSRIIERGACSWCGHKPHPSACNVPIRTSVKQGDPETPCPCKKRPKETQ